MAPKVEVQLGEEGHTAELVQQLLHHRYRKLVLDCRRVEGPIVHTEALGPITLL
jgi:hypothetical protein